MLSRARQQIALKLCELPTKCNMGWAKVAMLGLIARKPGVLSLEVLL